MHSEQKYKQVRELNGVESSCVKGRSGSYPSQQALCYCSEEGKSYKEKQSQLFVSAKMKAGFSTLCSGCNSERLLRSQQG